MPLSSVKENVCAGISDHPQEAESDIPAADAPVHHYPIIILRISFHPSSIFAIDYFCSSSLHSFLIYSLYFILWSFLLVLKIGRFSDLVLLASLDSLSLGFSFGLLIAR